MQNSEVIKQTVVSGHTFSVSTRYDFTNSRILGRGSYGVVATAVDTRTNEKLAIKRIRPYANDEWDARHTLREIRLLKVLGPHPNIITLFDLALFTDKTELYMMMELMDCDLHHIIQSKQALSEMHHKCFAKQMLEGIKAMHEVGVFHRDLKPGNLLVSKDCRLRITDFGLARYMDESTLAGQNSQHPMTEYVVTRWYRCPELLLAPNQPYNEAIDIWSIGCIMAELVRRKPLFPGKSHANQVQLILEVLGFSSLSELGFTVSAEASGFLTKRCKYPKQNLQDVIPQAGPEALAIISAMLSINPKKRPTAQAALLSPYLRDAEVLADYSVQYLQRPPPGYFDFETAKYTVEQLKGMIHEEVNWSGRIPPQQTGSRGSSKTPSPTRSPKKKLGSSASTPNAAFAPSSSFNPAADIASSGARTILSSASTTEVAVNGDRSGDRPSDYPRRGSEEDDDLKKGMDPNGPAPSQAPTQLKAQNYITQQQQAFATDGQSLYNARMARSNDTTERDGGQATQADRPARKTLSARTNSGGKSSIVGASTNAGNNILDKDDPRLRRTTFPLAADGRRMSSIEEGVSRSGSEATGGGGGSSGDAAAKTNGDYDHLVAALNRLHDNEEEEGLLSPSEQPVKLPDQSKIEAIAKKNANVKRKFFLQGMQRQLSEDNARVKDENFVPGDGDEMMYVDMARSRGGNLAQNINSLSDKTSGLPDSSRENDAFFASTVHDIPSSGIASGWAPQVGQQKMSKYTFAMPFHLTQHKVRDERTYAATQEHSEHSSALKAVADIPRMLGWNKNSGTTSAGVTTRQAAARARKDYEDDSSGSGGGTGTGHTGAASERIRRAGADLVGDEVPPEFTSDRGPRRLPPQNIAPTAIAGTSNAPGGVGGGGGGGGVRVNAFASSRRRELTRSQAIAFGPTASASAPGSASSSAGQQQQQQQPLNSSGNTVLPTIRR